MAARPLARSVLVPRSTPLSPGAIAGAVVGSIVGVAIIAICLFPFLVRARRRWLARHDEPTLAEMGQSPGGPIFPAQDLDDNSFKRCSGSGLENSTTLNHQRASPDQQPPSTLPPGVTTHQGLPSPVSSLSPTSRANSSLALDHGDSQPTSPVAAPPVQSPTEASSQSPYGSRGTIGREGTRDLSITDSYGPPSRELTGITSVGITEEPESFDRPPGSLPSRQHSGFTESIRSLLHRRHSSHQRRDSRRSTLGTDGARSPSITHEAAPQAEPTPSGLEIDPNTVGLAWDYYNDPTLGSSSYTQPAPAPISVDTASLAHPPTSVPISPVSATGQVAPPLATRPVPEDLDPISPDSDRTATPSAPLRSFSRQSTFGRKPAGPQRVDSLPPPTIVADIPSPPLQYNIGPSGNPMEMMKPTNPAENAWMLEHEMRMIQNPPPQLPQPPPEPSVSMPVPVDEVPYVTHRQNLEPNFQQPYQSPYQSPYTSPYQPTLEFGPQMYDGPTEYQNTNMLLTPDYSTPPPSTGPSTENTPDTRLTPYTASPSPPSDFDAVNLCQMAASPGLSPGLSSGLSLGPSPSPGRSPRPSSGRMFPCNYGQCDRVFDQEHKLK